jgi:hypothetical protein
LYALQRSGKKIMFSIGHSVLNCWCQHWWWHFLEFYWTPPTSSHPNDCFTRPVLHKYNLFCLLLFKLKAVGWVYDFSKCLINIFYPVRRASANKISKRAACFPRAAVCTTLF